jgi:2-keto-4-pentenoate hydratase
VTGKFVSEVNKAPANAPALTVANTIATAFVAARKQGAALPGYPGEKPVSLSAAYAIQDLAIALDGRPVVGWKVGKIPPPYDAQLGINRLAGPVFAGTVREANASGNAMPVFDGGFAAVEAEFLLHVAPGFDGTLPTNDTETLAILDDVRIGIEIASSPYAGINADGPLVTISDFGNNQAVILGPSVPNWRAVDLCAVPITTTVDGAVVGQASAATMLDGPLGAVRFLLANIVARGFDASAGLWVSTGAVTGVHPVQIGQQSQVVFGDLGTIDCHYAAAQPRVD